MEEPMAVLVRVSWKDVTAESYDEEDVPFVVELRDGGPGVTVRQ